MNKIADLLAALSSGKFPSQEQLNQLIRRILSSGVLEQSNEQGRGILSQRGGIILNDVAQLLQALLEAGAEKNPDDLVQDFLYQLLNVNGKPATVEAHLEGEVSSGYEAGVSKLSSNPPVTKDEISDDAQKVMSSLKTIVSLLFTSTAFRVLLSDILLTSREIVADFASEVGAVAETVAGSAGVVEDIVRPSEAEKAGTMNNRDMESSQRGGDRTENQHIMEKTLKQSEEARVEAEQKIEEATRESKERASAAWKTVSSSETPNRVKDQILWRVKSIVRQTQADPAYQQALASILGLLQKYAQKAIQTTHAATSAVETGLSSAISDTNVSTEVNLELDPHLETAMEDFKALVERFASGQSIDKVLRSIGEAIDDVKTDANAEEGTKLQELLRQAREWLDRALEDPNWTSSTEADESASKIYDDFAELMRDGSEEGRKVKTHLYSVAGALEDIQDGFRKDRSTQHVLSATSSLISDTAYLTAASKPDVANLIQEETRRTASQVKREVRNDILGFILPRLLRAIRVVPLPRVEYRSPSVDAVIDNLNLQAVSLIPDRLSLTNWNTLEFVGSDGARERGSRSVAVTTSGVPIVTVSEAQSRVRIQIEGLRISAKDIAYWVDARGPAIFGWNDNGLLSIDVGERGDAGQGLKVVIDVEMVGENLDDPNPLLVEETVHSQFKVLDVKVDIPGLKFTISQSRHWIFNSLLLQPLLGPSVKQLLGTILQSQIRSALEKIDQKFGEAKKSAQKRGASSAAVWDWWNVLIRTPDKSVDEEESDSDTAEGPHTPPTVQTSTHVTFKGVVRRMHEPATKPDQDTVIAVGVGEQILPDAPLPQIGIQDGGHAKRAEDVRPVLAQQGREALDDLQQGADQLTDTVADVVHTADEARNRVREEVVVASERLEQRKRLESRRKGWRSNAFEIN
ncbi:hypothetical protein FRC03_004159 [Tulasnella sp. 419]|nr:hypothetical protein FRC03_004159 [Tulasnella sp. 419]